MRRRVALLLTVVTAVLMAVASPAWATTFTVNSTADTGDPTPDGTCDTCTLREAMQEASANNNAPTVDLINFAIPGAGPHTISPNSELPDIDDPLTIDGYTETLGEATPATPNTLAFGTNAVLKIVISGASAPLGSDGFDVEAGPTTIRGLVINGFKEDNVGSGGQAIGIFNVAGNTNNVIEGNFIGTNVAGTAAVPNEGDGVILFGPNGKNNTIGGVSPDKRNLIAGSGEQGIEISGSDANTVQGNLVGVHISSAGIITDVGNEQDGIRMTSSSNNVVSNNVVAFNGDATHPDNGVEVLKSGTATPVGNRILSNSIFSNQVLGIDLSNSGSGGREQDAGDPDTGPNNLQNFPLIQTATTSGTATTIKGTLNTSPSTLSVITTKKKKKKKKTTIFTPQAYTIQFFSNPVGTDQGRTYLGQIKGVTTDLAGNASFEVLGPPVSVGQLITATATKESTGDTSEFSDEVAVAAAS